MCAISKLLPIVVLLSVSLSTQTPSQTATLINRTPMPFSIAIAYGNTPADRLGLGGLPRLARHFAQRAFWAATILRRAACDIERPLRVGIICCKCLRIARSPLICGSIMT
jgi:hypothetical protein